MESLLITFLAGAFFLVGVLIAFFITNKEKLINFSVGISFSVLILLIILDILPETLELFEEYHFIKIITGVILGILLLLIIEKIVPHSHDDDCDGDYCLEHIAVITAIALIIHNVIEGTGIYALAEASFKSGIIYAGGVALHNIPFGIKITAMLKNSSQLKLWTYIILLTTSTFLGGLIIHLFNSFLSNNVLGYLLSITIGMIIYILGFELFKLLKENFNKYTISGIIIGIILMFLGVVI